ncbi:MAG: hypothetical protein V7784_03440 [Oceanospirillaceae bacterium]
MKRKQPCKYPQIAMLRTIFIKLFSTALNTFYFLPLVFRGLLLGPTLLVLAIIVYQWFIIEDPQRSLTIINTQTIQHPNYHSIATRALAKFESLPALDKNNLVANLKSNISPLQQWLDSLVRFENLTLCLGESHREITRDFLASQIFKDFSFNVLFLETSEQKLEKINQRLASTTDYFPLLNADILQILRTVQHKNPAIDIYAIDAQSRANDRQSAKSQATIKTREEQIYSNFKRYHTQNTRSIILFGAVHCSFSDTWLYGKLISRLEKKKPQQLLNTRVFSEHEDGPIEAFVYFLDQLAPISGHFVINNTKLFSELINQWFPLTQQVTFKPFQSIVIYRHELMKNSP